MINEIVSILILELNVKRCKNNHTAWIANKCINCDGNGKKIFRYNSKLKVGKCYNCGFSFKDITRLRERIKYLSNLKDKVSMTNSGFEKFKNVDQFNLPF